MDKLAKWLFGVGLAVIVGLMIWFQTRPEPAPVTAPADTAATEAATDSGATPVAEASPGAPAEPVKAPAEPPQFDVVRVSPEGQTVLAGRAAPGQTVEVLLDGKVIGTAEADAAGAFAAVLELEPSAEARVLTMRTPLEGVPETTVALAASPEAVETAAAEQASAEAVASEATAAAAKAAADAAVKRAAAAAAISAAAAADAAAAAAAAKAAAAQAAAGGSASGQSTADAATAEAKAAETAAALATAKAVAAKDAAVSAATVEAAAVTTAETAIAEAIVAKQAADAAAASAEPNVARFAVSTPVIILPPAGAEQAPVLVKPEAAGVTLLQPAEVEPAAGIVLDRLTYSEAGDLVAAGRGRPGSAVRIYANAVFLEQIQFGGEGQWQVKIPSDIATSAVLLRFDEVDATGHVLSRIETPFEYSPLVASHELRDRKIVVQKGDYLWKFAEQSYGAGWRYSVIFNANAALIRDPDLIYPGQVFSIPELVNRQ